MAKIIPGRNGGKLKIPEKGDRFNPNGRPRKWISAIIDQGYKRSEVHDAIRVLLSLTPNEVRKVLANPEATVLEVSVASAILTAIQKGNLETLETLLSRVDGKPTSYTEVTGADGTPLFPVNFVVADNKTLENLKKLKK